MNETSMDQKGITERPIIDVVCSWRCSINSLTHISFIKVLYGKNAFSAGYEFLAVIPQVATWQNWTQG